MPEYRVANCRLNIDGVEVGEAPASSICTSFSATSSDAVSAPIGPIMLDSAMTTQALVVWSRFAQEQEYREMRLRLAREWCTHGVELQRHQHDPWKLQEGEDDWEDLGKMGEHGVILRDLRGNLWLSYEYPEWNHRGELDGIGEALVLIPNPNRKARRRRLQAHRLRKKGRKV